MPTELSTTLTRRRDGRVQPPADMTIMLVCLIVNLVVLVLLFVDEGFAQALQFLGLY